MQPVRADHNTSRSTYSYQFIPVAPPIFEGPRNRVTRPDIHSLLRGGEDEHGCPSQVLSTDCQIHSPTRASLVLTVAVLPILLEKRRL
jgi:hypothetical protein